jgi:hypothetical protein
VVQVAEHLPSKCKALRSNPRAAKQKQTKKNPSHYSSSELGTYKDSFTRMWLLGTLGGFGIGRIGQL